MTLLRTTLLTALLSLALGAGAEAAPEAIYGPGPRALDNREIFAAANLPLWQELDRAGVEGIVLNASFLMTTDFRGMRGDHQNWPRPKDTYLSDDDLAGLAQIVARTGLEVTYEAGVGLSGDRCDASLSPEALGREAAAFEFERNVRRLTDAGIPVSAINVDGPMLRLLPDSGKRASCQVTVGTGFPLPVAARIAQAYMTYMRDRLEATQGGRPVEVRWLVNLPNWQAGRVPRLGNGKGEPTTDFAEVLKAFAQVQAENRLLAQPLEISEIVIDYPYAYVLQNFSYFGVRVRNLWNASRDLNPSGRPPPLGFIVNSRSYSHPCLKREGEPDLAFLTFRRGEGAVSEACQRAQIGEDTAANAQDGAMDNDTDYLRDSFTYVDGLKPGGELAKRLVLRDGTRIADHVAHLYYQSWGVNPLSNAWYMERLIERLEHGDR
ncbi:hypothetical protein [Cereibacter sphaeroides]|jgi:hypothetical protein|uniref:hypothetical protein n=1 Tax=Cereibacter sphaeroides TaxID=1063 RepID=UPI0000664293|nr:hypothetical protein Rsph17029_4092 [Cereibacter sphaeroides ATCC 17029]EKX56836.1 hypothetical protein D516_2285 [Rhodobacter sp. AKP1]